MYTLACIYSVVFIQSACPHYSSKITEQILIKFGMTWGELQ